MVLGQFEKFGNYINDRCTDTGFSVVIIFAIVIAFCEAVAQGSMKHYSNNKECNSRVFIIIGMIGYILVSLLLLTSYKYEDIGHMNMIWSCMSIIIAYLSGYIFFNECINKYTIASITAAFAAIYLGRISDDEIKRNSEI